MSCDIFKPQKESDTGTGRAVQFELFFGGTFMSDGPPTEKLGSACNGQDTISTSCSINTQRTTRAFRVHSHVLRQRGARAVGQATQVTHHTVITTRWRDTILRVGFQVAAQRGLVGEAALALVAAVHPQT